MKIKSIKGAQAAKSAAAKAAKASSVVVKANSGADKGGKQNGATSALVFADAKQLYRLFKAIDGGAYNLQGEATICALRGGRMAMAENPQSGAEVAVMSGSQGVACIIGKRLKGVDGGTDAIQAGRFVLSLKGQKLLGSFASWAQFGAWIKAKGAKARGEGKARFERAIGLDSKYGFAVDSKGRAFRLESNTSKRGAAWFYNLGE